MPPGVELRANPKSISHRCHLFGVASVWELTEKTYICPWVVPRAVDKAAQPRRVEVERSL